MFAPEIARPDPLEAFYDLAVLRHQVEQGPGLHWIQIHAVVLARWRILIVMPLSERILGFHGVNESKRQHIALARESVIAAFECLFAHARIRIGRKLIALPDNSMRPGGGLHGAEWNVCQDLFIQVILPVCDLRMELVE